MLHLIDPLGCLSHLEMGIPLRSQSFKKKFDGCFEVGSSGVQCWGFHLERNQESIRGPKKICSYSPYIMYMVEKVERWSFPKM
jgi:hypothetical protein